MKVNLKKIGAIVAGATILASTAAFAGLYFGDTMLVDDNGAPTVKIVVGENAAASDGVGGALAAGKIVGESYKTEELTAKITGTATTDCGNGTATGGTCAISNEKAQLEITVPGGVAEGSYTINNLIGDYLNRRLEDRVGNIGANTDAEYPIGGSDFSENANPFTDGADSNIGPSETFMFRVSGSMFSPFATSTITDDTAAKTYSEQQDAWVRGSSYYSDSDNDVVGDLRFLAYTLKFKGASDDFGIPVCTTPTGQDYTYCKSGATDANFDYATETHKVKVQFLGEPWIISEMSPPSTVATSETQVYAGGYVKLAKESVSGILNQGESLPVDDLKFHLDDLEAHGDTTSAIISVLDANDNILKKDKVTPGATKEFSIGGKIYRFHVYKVAPGYTFGAKWADVAIFAKELKVEDGQHLDPDYDDNEDWQAAVGWKNKGAQTGVDEQVDHLRTIVLYSDDIAALSSSGEAKLEENDYLPIVEDPVAWKLTYAGLSITSSQRNSLKYQLERTSNYTISSSKGPLSSNGTRVSCTIAAPYVKISSSKSGSVFEVTGDDGTGTATTLSDNQFYVATSGLAAPLGFVCSDDGTGGCPNGMTLNGSECWPTNPGHGTVFMKLSPTSSYYGYKLYDWTTPLSTEIDYQTIGDGDTTWETGGVLEIAYYTHAIGASATYMGDLRGAATGTCVSESGTEPRCFGITRLTEGTAANDPDWYFAFSEKAGVDTSNNIANYVLNGLYLGGTTPGDATFNWDSKDAAADYITREDYTLYMYAGPVNTRGSITTLEEGGITERGSVFSSVDDTSVTYYMANELARSQFVLATAGESASEAMGTCIRTLAEGETSEPCNGVTVKVLQITEDVGACSASGGTGCTVNMEDVGAVIMPGNVASVTQVVPYANAYKDLVILDRDAVGVNTVVSIGGDKVNTVTAQLLQGSPVDWTTERVVVKEVVKGSKIVVAGAEADDTLEAVDNFISQLRRA